MHFRTKLLLIMKFTTVLILTTALQVSARSYSQQVTYAAKNESVQTVFAAIEKQTGYSFFYNNDDLKGAHPVSIEVKNLALEKALEILFRDQPFGFNIQGKTISIKAKIPAKKTELLPEPMPIAIDTVRPAVIENKIKAQGHIISDEGEPLSGAAISIHPPGHPALVAGITDANGNFKLVNLANGVYVLELSYIGYEKLERTIQVTDKMLVLPLLVMKKSTNALDAIQLTAYSKTTARFNTGDITTITADEIAHSPVPNVLQALQGRVPGMLVTEQTGMPNGGFQVQIRSVNTMYGTSTTSPQLLFTTTGQPLYIVDGVEYPANGTLSMANGYGPQAQLYGNALNYLDPSIIESVNILKGVDATAIYGSRGAFGVFLITTKRGKAGKPSLTVNITHGISTLGVSPKLMNQQQYLALRHNAFANDGTVPGPTDYDINGTWDSTQNTDWKKFFLGGNAPTTRINLAYSGGGVNSNFLIGVQYSSIGNIELSKGVVRQGGMNFSLNTATADRKFTLLLSGSYSANLENMTPADLAGNITQAPDAPYPYLPDGKLNWTGGSNAVAVLNSIHSNNTDNLVANVTMTYAPIPGLSFIASGGYSLLSAKEFTARPSSVFNPATFTVSQTGSLINLYRTRILNADPRVQFNHNWGKGHLEVITGLSLKDQLQQRNAIVGSGFASDELVLNPSAATPANTSTVYSLLPTKYIRPFATVNFRWADKYILNLTGSRDGSSVFGPSNQFGNFGSVSGAWIISDESWFRKLLKVVDFLKLKASYGLVGANAISPYLYINTYGLNNSSYQGGIGLSPQNLANPYLHWETNKNLEAGLNFELFKGVINAEAIYYNNRVSDQLTSQALASITGFTQFLVNTPAVFRAYGAEFRVTTRNIQKKNFSWSTSANFTLPRTKLLAFPGLGGNVNNINYVIGQPITGIKLVKFAGVDPATGVYNFYNAAGVKGEFTPIFSPTQLDAVKDRTEFVDLAAKWQGGMTNTITYKNVALDFLISFTSRVGPNYLGFLSFVSPGSANNNFPVDIVDRRWMKPGDITDVPKASAGINALLDQSTFRNSTGAFSDATYARLQNLSLSYRLPDRLIKKAHMSSATFRLTGQNLFTISKYKGLDPENMMAGRIPPLRIFTAGLTVGF